MARKYKANRRKRAKDAYTTYKRWRRTYEKQGYAMDRQMTRSEFHEYLRFAKDKGIKNPTREIARSERAWGGRSALRIAAKTHYTKEEIIALGRGDSGSDESKMRKEVFEAFIQEAYDGDYAAGREAWEALY